MSLHLLQDPGTELFGLQPLHLPCSALLVEEDVRRLLDLKMFRLVLAEVDRTCLNSSAMDVVVGSFLFFLLATFLITTGVST